MTDETRIWLDAIRQLVPGVMADDKAAVRRFLGLVANMPSSLTWADIAEFESSLTPEESARLKQIQSDRLKRPALRIFRPAP